MENTRPRRSGGLRNIITAVFAVAFVASTVSTITAFAAANLFKIQNAELSELSTTAEGSISSFDEENIVSSVTFHKLDDSAKYTITLKNTDTKDHIIESITDDNINPYISYEYSQHMGEQIDAGSDFVFVITAKYSAAITNIDQRAQVSNVKFFIHFTDVEEEILLVPNTGASSNTGNFIRFSVLSLVISAAALTIAGIFALKKYKKASKYIVAGIVTVAAITTTATVKAVTVEINSFTISTDVTLKDKLAVTYTDKNGNEQELIVNYGEPANIPDQNKDGYTLTGWEDENGNPVDPTQPTTEDIKIHPIYRTHTYTIKFNGNGANGEMTDLAMTYDETKALPTNAFDFPGRTYTGWDTEANGSGVHYDDESEVKNLTTEDNGIVTLYAQWSINPFHIDYDGNGATGGEMATTNCEYDGECVLRENAFEKTGYHFVGWKYSDNDYADKADVKNIIESGTITMVAQWAINHYTIIFDINTDDSNASGDMADMANLEYGQDYTLTANAFTRTGYNFGGWNTEIDGRNFGLTDEQEFHNLTATDNAVITLYAQWNPIHYNVVFHQNHDDVTGNTNSMTNIAYDDTRALTQNGFELAHYKFMGWNSAEDGTGTPYEDKASIKNLTAMDGATVDLYAQWKERTATLNTGANVRTALKGLADAPTTFKKYDGENLPDFDTLDGKVDIALADSNFPVWAWVDGDNIYWWSEAERPNFNRNSNNMFQSMTTLTTIDLDGLESSTAVNMSYLFNGCTGLTSLDISEFNTANVENMSAMFYNTPALTSINTAVLNTASVKDMSSMFRETGATSIDISNFDTENVKTMASMFEKTKASSITLGNPDTLNVTNMSCMFQDTLNITSLDVSGLDTDNVESMSNMFMAFNGTPKLTSLDLSNFKTSKVKNFSGMFYGQSKITSLDVSNFNTSSATTMYMMFLGMSKAQSIDVSGWTNNLGPSMEYMFSYTGTSGTVINFDNFNTENVTNMSHMFSDMRSQTVLDLSSFDTAKVKNMSGMFSSSYASTPMALKTVYISDKFVTTALTSDADNIFANARAIVGGAGTTWDVSSIEKARIDNPDNGKPGYFTYKNARYVRYHDNDGDDTNDETNYALMTSHYLKAGDSLKKNAFTRRGFRFTGWKDADDNEYTDEQVMADLTESKTPLELYAQWSEITATLNTGANVNTALKRIAGDATSFEIYTAGTPDFSTIDGEQIISANNSPAKVYAWQDAEAGKIYWWSEAYQPKFNANSASMFAGLTKLTNIDLTDLNASTATNLSNLYKGDTALVSTNITAQDTSNVTNMNSMFMNTGFTELSLEGLETNNVTDMANMFNGAKNITTLDTTPLNTEKATTMSAMFANTTALDSINLTDFDTSSVTNMSSMFSASGISSINLASFDTTNVTNISSMFKSTTNLATVDLSPLEVQSVTTMASLFESSGITSIDVAPLATESVTDMSAMFKNTLGLTELNVAPLNTTNVTTMKDMFYGSYHLASLDVSMLDTANVQNMSGTFGILGRETVLKMYDISETTKFTTSNVTDMSNMFRGDRELNQGLVNIDLSHIDTSKVTSMSGMFKASRARSLDFSHFDTRKVTNMSQMFFIAPYLSRIDLSAFETPELKNVGQMFYYDGGTGASVIDMRNFDFSKANLADLAPYGPWGGKTYYMGKFDLSSTTANTEINLGSNGTQKIYVNTEYDPSIALERNIRVRVVANGMNGTVANNTTRTYAEYQRIDDPAHDEPGFFWIENPLVVNFDAQGGTASRTKYSYIPGTDYGTLPTVTNGPEGKVFAGWYTAAEGGEKVENGGTFASNEAHTLYAQWVEATSVLQTGSSVNAILKSINPDAVAFTRYNGIPDFDMIGDERVISLSNAVVPTYTWSNDDTIYWWSEAETVYLNENSGSFFKNLSKLTSIEQTTLDTSKVKNMDYMFQYSGLVDFTFEMDTSNVMSMDAIFANCSKLERLDLSHVDTSKVTNMHGLVADAQKLTYLNLDNFSTASATNLESMFSTVKLMTTLDLTSFDTRNVTNMAWMISYITNLQTIYATDLFVPANNLSMPNTLVGGAGSRSLGTSSVYARIDDPDNGAPGYFTIKGARYIRYNDNDGDTTNDEANRALMTSEYLKAGDSLKKNAFTRGGYVFTGWKDADNNEYTDEQVMANLTESKTPLELYAQWDTAPYVVTFNANGGEVLQGAKTVTYLQPYGELPTPVKYDYANSILGGKYSFKEWNTKADGSGDTITSSSIYENTDDTTLYAIWNGQFTVTVYNGESETPTTASYGTDNIVYLNAQDVAGKQFLYWEVDGAKKAYNKNYSMRMFQGKDLTIRAIYGSESDLESQQPGTYISDIYRQYSENRVVVRSYSYIPDGYEIVKAGVVATLDADIANGTFDDQTATYPRAANVNGSSDNYYYTWSKSNITSEQTVYVKAYLIYKDADGVEHTIYGDLVTATLTE